MIKENRQFRHELKFCITALEKTILQNRLQSVMQLDQHAKDGFYLIRSLYFDDAENTAYNEKMAGVSSRKKYRIRMYNQDTSHIKLECKHKEGQYIYKEMAPLSKEETEQILSGNIAVLYSRQEAICKEFCKEYQFQGLRPKVMIDYDRIPYIYPFGTVRVTFDEHIRTCYFGLDFFDDHLPMNEVMQADELVLEVKYTEFIPSVIQELLQMERSQQTAASKYIMCRANDY